MTKNLPGKPSLSEVFRSFLLLGMTAFGGPAMIAYIQDMCVKEKRWVSEDEFHDGVALVQAIPGATAMQMAAYAGMKTAGAASAIAAYTGFAIPAFLMMLGISYAYKYGQDISQVISFFKGLQSIVIAIVANASVNFSRKHIENRYDFIIALAGATYIAYGGNPVTVIILSGMAGTVLYREIARDSTSAEVKGHRRPFAHNMSKAHLAAPGMLAIFLLFLYLSDRKLFELGLMMAKIDLFAFGGGYASLPMMLHEIVVSHHLLDTRTLMDGIALGQITPGPIVITATFAGLLLYGLPGAVTATFCIFAPSFIILLMTVPWFDMMKRNPWFVRIIRGILCSFCGFLVAVTIKFALAATLQPVPVAITVAAFIALRYRINIIWVVAAGGITAIFLM
jgi:chromate transporter